MPKARLFAVAVIVAALGVTAVVYAQQNSYTVTGSVTPSGGTKSKPKPVTLSFSYTTAEAGGPTNVPSPIKTYAIAFEGIQVNTSVVKKKCTAAQINAAASDSRCSAAAKVGSGLVTSRVGTAGQPSNTTCALKLTLYNAGGTHLALYLKGQPPTCITPISQAIDGKYKKTATGTTLSFTVPEVLRHQLNLAIAVTKVSSKINRITGKKAGKTVGYFQSIGCKDRKRDIAVTFTDETNKSVPAKKTLARC